MKTLKSIAKVAILLVVVTLSINSAFIARAQAPAPIIPTDIKGQIAYYANIYGSNTEQLETVAQCESGFSPYSYGDHGLAYGTFQFHRETFERYAKAYQIQMGGTLLEYDNTQNQIKLAAWMFSLGKGVKENWTCYTKNFGV